MKNKYNKRENNMKDSSKIEYAVLQDECRKLNEQRYGNDIFIAQIKEDLKQLNEKVDDLCLVIEDLVKDTPTYKEAELLLQLV